MCDCNRRNFSFCQDDDVGIPTWNTTKQQFSYPTHLSFCSSLALIFSMAATLLVVILVLLHVILPLFFQLLLFVLWLLSSAILPSSQPMKTR